MNFPERSSSTTLNTIFRDIVLQQGTTMSKHEHQRNTPMKTLPAPLNQGGTGKSLRLVHNNLAISREQKKLETSDRFVNGIKEHVKGKLSLGAKFILGGMEKAFRKIFNVREGERLLKASHCCVYTTAGPITGLLFISTEKICFCSDKSVVKLLSPTGEFLRFRYKLVVPLRKIERALQGENTAKKSKKYLQLITMDKFEFWFMGFIDYKKMFKCLHQAISRVPS